METRFSKDTSSRLVWTSAIAGRATAFWMKRGKSFWKRKWRRHRKMKQIFAKIHAWSYCPGDRNTFSLGKPAAKGAGAHGARGARAKGAIDHQEQSKRSSTRCADTGTAGTNRS